MKTIETLYAQYRIKDTVEESSFYDFEAGFLAAKKEFNKLILDSLNELRSNLSDAERVKLTKVVNEEKVKLLNSQIEVILKLKNKL